MDTNETHGLLLVDTDREERARLKHELEASGWTVWAAADATTALRIIAEHHCEVSAAIVDLQLPGLQGRRIMAELEQLDPQPACVAISGRLSPVAVDTFRRISRSPLLVKPVQHSQVDALLRERTLSGWEAEESTDLVQTGGAR